MQQSQLKQAAAQTAMSYLMPKLESKSIIGIGTGSTTNYFIDLLANHKMDFEGAVASSELSAQRLKKHGIPVYDRSCLSKDFC